MKAALCVRQIKRKDHGRSLIYQKAFTTPDYFLMMTERFMLPRAIIKFLLQKLIQTLLQRRPIRLFIPGIYEEDWKERMYIKLMAIIICIVPMVDGMVCR